MILAIALLLTGAAVYLLALVVIPLLEEKRRSWQAEKERVIEKKLDNMFSHEKSSKDIVKLYYILPPLLGVLGWLLLKSAILALAGAFLGLSIPSLILKIRDTKRRDKFNHQLLDAIMILSSSLKGGLSLLQALEVLVEEMPAPMSQEIGLVVNENRMGIPLEDCLKNLNKRMNIEELSLVVNSLLVARETGGDLIKVFNRLCITIRDNRKLKDSIKTLTLQGRLQGLIMSALPFVFIWFILSHNRQHFDFMLKSDAGRALLILAVVLQVVGMVLIRKFSTIKT
ncbi:MAG: hypothetical protein FJZ13_04165 [Candidatus Omnitrophica bacterium]|nr:hypothetical protein [Candidatus Omnitrophota bacterium]